MQTLLFINMNNETTHETKHIMVTIKHGVNQFSEKATVVRKYLDAYYADEGYKSGNCSSSVYGRVIKGFPNPHTNEQLFQGSALSKMINKYSLLVKDNEVTGGNWKEVHCSVRHNTVWDLNETVELFRAIK
jgi:hypothetical protein